MQKSSPQPTTKSCKRLFSPSSANLPVRIERHRTKRLRNATTREKNRKRGAISYKRFNVDKFSDEHGEILGPYLTEMCRMKFLSQKMKRMRYTPYQIWFASNLMLGTSSKSYKFLRHILPLPSHETVMRTLRKLQSSPGISEKNANLLKTKVNPRKESDNFVFLLMDEMSIRKGLSLHQSSGTIHGFADNGKMRERKLTTSALVVMAVGIVSPWKYPLGFVFTEQVMKAESIIDIIKESISVMEKQGFVVFGITTDRGSNFERAFKLMGVSPTSPKIEIEGKSYYIYRDAPHLLKNSRNCLEKIDIAIPGSRYHASWRKIKEFHKLDSGNSLQIAPKLTQMHVDGLIFGARMKVKLAAHVLSNTVSAGIDLAIGKNLISTTAAGTSIFCKKINDIFDSLNASTSRDPVPLRKPFFCDDVKRIRFLKESVTWLEELRDINSKRISGMANGWIQSINVVLQLSADLKKRSIPYLSTRRLCQDALELHFGKIRQISNYTDSQSFISSYAQIASASLVRAPLGSNCEGLSEDHLSYTLSFMNNVSL